MVAAAFTETLIFKGTSNGKTVHMRMTVSDVAAAYAVAPDGQGLVQLPSDQNYALVDVIVVTGGTDTTNQEIYVNGLSSGLVLDNKSNLNTANFRQFATAPVVFAGGSVLRFKQAA
jgi:hypothetical protein